jgi:hypothetical protein
MALIYLFVVSVVVVLFYTIMSCCASSVEKGYKKAAAGMDVRRFQPFIQFR